LPDESLELLLDNSISPLPLHKTILLLEDLNMQGDMRFVSHERLALAKSLIAGISNLAFGPEVGLGKIKQDAPVSEIWLAAVREMAEGLQRRPL
jgi:hypothetical protein